MALPKKEKLKDRRVFRNTRRLQNISKNKYFRLIGQSLHHAVSGNSPLVSFVISKKKLKSAVKRNRSKRRMEEAYRSSKEVLTNQLSQFKYLIFFLEAESLEANFQTLKKQIISSFK
ncbi:MAG: ribonuclease P protein component [Candidatus Caenarcaniphilales bacterium]|nr:ribonuclease P protein component [Candidatus Caenarcaniphilales bacterium]